MILEKRPRHYAFEIIEAKTTEEKRAIFQSAPEKYRDTILCHVEDYEIRQQYKKSKKQRKLL